MIVHMEALFGLFSIIADLPAHIEYRVAIRACQRVPDWIKCSPTDVDLFTVGDPYKAD